MAKLGDRTRAVILERAYGLFYREGFQRTGMNQVAEAAGVTKRTLYNHFPSKDALFAEVLRDQVRLAAVELTRWAGGTPESPEACVTIIFAELRAWSQSPDWRGSGFSRAAMELAWAPGHPGRAAAAVQKDQVERAITGMLERSGARAPDDLARAILLLIEGAMVLRLIHGADHWIDVGEQSAKELVRSGGGWLP